jgi:hypothetical protein
VLPGIYFFPAIAVGTLVVWLRERWPASRIRAVLAPLVLIAFIGFAAVSAARDYFGLWAPSAQAYEAFDGESVDAAQWLNANPAQWPVYLSAEFYRHASFMMLHGQVPTTSFFSHRDPAVRWFDGTGALPLPPADTAANYIFTGSAHSPKQALDRYLPDRIQQEVILDPAGEPSVTVYRASSRDLRQVAVDIALNSDIRVVGYDVYGEARPGQTLGVALHWQFAGTDADDAAGFRVRVGLVGQSGELWPSADNPLQYRPAEWDPQGRAVSWHLLSLPTDASPGRYDLALSLVRADSGVVVSDWVSLPSSSVDTDTLNGEVRADFGDRLQLLDVTAELESTGSGVLETEMVLHLDAQFDQAYTLFLHVYDAQGQRIGQRDSALGSGLYPLDVIPEGATVRETCRVPIRPESGKPHVLAVGFYDWRTGDRLTGRASDGTLLADDQFLLSMTSQE